MEKISMEKISTVVIIPCPSYDQELTDQAVRDGFACLGGAGNFIRKDEKLLLKPNLLKKADPEQAVTTHPSVFAAVGRYLKEYGCDRLYYGDSPAMQSFIDAARQSGLYQVAEQLGIFPGDFLESVTLSWPQGRAAREFIVSRAIVDTDGIVNICKMKTHALERITGAVKNLYGCIHGTHKGAGHVRYPSAFRFASMLCDLHQAIKPRLHIMDGIVAMEGNGPSSGTPAAMGVLLFSQDPVALDTVFCRLIHLDPSLVPTNLCGWKYRIGTMKEEQIRLLTMDRSRGKGSGTVTEIRIEDAVLQWGKAGFAVDRNPFSEREGWKLLRKAAKPFQRRPRIHPEKCIRCGICVESCPVEGKAVTFQNGKGQPPVYQDKKCIRCYCCQEICPQKAIDVKPAWLSGWIR